MRFGLIAAALMTALPASAQTLTLEPGGSAALTANARGDFTIAAQGRDAEWLEPDRLFLDRARGVTPDENNMIPGRSLPGDTAQPVPIVPGQVTIRFLTNRRESVLSIQNGLGQGFVYRARIWTGSRPEPTDVCLVQPRNRIYEHWPYVIARIELTAFRLQPWSYGDPVPCV